MLRARFRPGSLLTLLFFVAFLAATIRGWEWPYVALLMPVYFVAIPGIVLCLLQFYRDLVGWEEREGAQQRGVEMDEVFLSGSDPRTEVRRTLTFFGWLMAGVAGIWLLGITIALPLLVLAYAHIDGRESWRASLPLTGGVFLFLWGLFEYVLNIHWPPGALFG